MKIGFSESWVRCKFVSSSDERLTGTFSLMSFSIKFNVRCRGSISLESRWIKKQRHASRHYSAGESRCYGIDRWGEVLSIWHNLWLIKLHGNVFHRRNELRLYFGRGKLTSTSLATLDTFSISPKPINLAACMAVQTDSGPCWQQLLSLKYYKLAKSNAFCAHNDWLFWFASIVCSIETV